MKREIKFRAWDVRYDEPQKSRMWAGVKNITYKGITYDAAHNKTTHPPVLIKRHRPVFG